MDFRIVNVDEIKVNRDDRFRDDLGDLSELVETIKENGKSINPISVDEDMVLIAGERRLEAHKQARLYKIAVHVWTGLTDKQKLFLQHIENDQRKDLKPSEKAKSYLKLKGMVPERRGKPTKGLKVFEDGENNQGKISPITKTPTKAEKMAMRAEKADEPEKGEKTSDYAAKATKFATGKEAEKTAKVLKQSPKELMKAVDDKVVSVYDAAAIADEPAEKQIEALERVKSGQAKTLKAGLAEPKQSAKSKAAIRAALKHDAPSEDSEPTLDPNKRVIPAVLSQVMADSEAFSEFTRHLAELIKLIKEARVDGHRSAHLPLSALNDAENLKMALQSNTFYCVCVYCEGKQLTDRCGACHGAGWINKVVFDRAPREKKKVS